MPKNTLLLNNYKKDISSIKKRQSYVGNKSKLDRGVKYVEEFMKELKDNPRLLELWDEIDRRNLLSDDYKSMGVWGKIMYLLENGNIVYGNDPYKNKKSNVLILPKSSVKKHHQTSVSLPQRRVTYASPSSNMQQHVSRAAHAAHAHQFPSTVQIPQIEFLPHRPYGHQVHHGPYLHHGPQVYYAPVGTHLHQVPRVNHGPHGPHGNHGSQVYNLQSQRRRRPSPPPPPRPPPPPPQPQQPHQEYFVMGEAMGGYKNKAKKRKSKKQ